MEEKSDTPRTDAAAQFVSHFGWQVHADFARDLERELATATRERDEARAIANDRDAMVDHRDRALTAMYQRVDVITRERDEARVSVDTLRAAIKTAEAALADIGDSDHEPSDDLAWCERRAQQALPVVRFALAAAEAKP